MLTIVLGVIGAALVLGNLASWAVVFYIAYTQSHRVKRVKIGVPWSFLIGLGMLALAAYLSTQG